MSRLHEEARRALIAEIVSGTRPEGNILRESDLMERFGFSRNVARESIRGLEERGMVSVRHGRGAIVAPAERWSRFDEEVVAALLRSERAPDVLGEYLECRRILEVEAAGLAAERATEVTVDALSNAFGRMRSAAETARKNRAAEGEYRKADIAFHRAIVLATSNPALGMMTEPIHLALTASFGALARPGERLEKGLPEHERILEAVRRRDPDAAREAMRQHLLTVERHLREFAG